MSGCNSLFDLGALDLVARGRSPIHSLDARAKLVVTLAFALAVVSLGKYALADLLPFFVFPFVILALSNVPPGLVASRVAVMAPFAVMVGIFNPLMDRDVVLRIGEIGISGGWISFLSILLRFALTISSLVLLVGTSGVPAIGHAAEKLGAPQVFVTQVLGLYRYLFLLIEETQRVLCAYRLRSPHGRPPSWGVFSQILGQLLLRALARAHRVYEAMRCRGFDGEIRRFGVLKFTGRDWAFVITWLTLFAILRFLHPSDMIGRVILGIAA